MKVRNTSSGVHIFSRLTGLNILLEEVTVSPALWASAPRHVSIALTNECDLCCPHCFAPKYPASLDFERVAAWLEELDNNGCLGIGFGGGEPTLYPRFAELCHYATQNTELAVTFTTHAHHLDEALASALKGNVHFIRVSMDGVATTYEAIRGRSFQALCGRFNTIRALVPFGINIVINANTLPEIEAVAALAAEVGASEILLIPEQPYRGRGGIDIITFEALKNWVNLYRGTVPLTISEIGADGMPTCDPLHKESGLLAYAHIDASGSLMRSSFDSNGVAIGSGSVMETLNRLRNNLEV